MWALSRCLCYLHLHNKNHAKLSVEPENTRNVMIDHWNSPRYRNTINLDTCNCQHKGIGYLISNVGYITDITLSIEVLHEKHSQCYLVASYVAFVYSIFMKWVLSPLHCDTAQIMKSDLSYPTRLGPHYCDPWLTCAHQCMLDTWWD